MLAALNCIGMSRTAFAARSRRINEDRDVKCDWSQSVKMTRKLPALRAAMAWESLWQYRGRKAQVIAPRINND